MFQRCVDRNVRRATSTPDTGCHKPGTRVDVGDIGTMILNQFTIKAFESFRIPGSSPRDIPAASTAGNHVLLKWQSRVGHAHH